MLLIVLLFTRWGSAISQRSVARLFRSRGVSDEGTIAGTNRLVHYTILIIGIGIALQTIGVNLAALFAAGAVFAVAVGFAMQTILQNFVSGVILLLERAIKPGDVLEADGRLIRVVRMGIRTTVARTLDDEDLIIPNSNLVQATVKNYTFRDSLYRVRVTVGVSYHSDMKQVDQVLGATAKGLPSRVQESEPVILMTRFDTSSVNFEVSVWIRHPWDTSRVRSELHHAIWDALQDAGITIAFPQLDVHMTSPLPPGEQELPKAA